MRTAGLQGSGELTVSGESEVPKRLAKVLALLPVLYLSAKAISNRIVTMVYNRVAALLGGISEGGCPSISSPIIKKGAGL